MGSRRIQSQGISPVISSVLLILVALAAGLVIYAYVTGWMGGRLTGETGPQAILVIEEAYYNGSHFILWVRNDGGVPVNITRAYITDPNGTVVFVDLSDDGYEVKPGNVTDVHIDASEAGIDVQSGYTYEIKLVGSDGSTVSTPVRARRAG
ncbi:MAG: hypothetical protein DRO12_03975 [Thermoprotei archaeon]|nr:MAG: hypothetical protein DRO12_03975 [Thermoprotei archaeon]